MLIIFKSWPETIFFLVFSTAILILLIYFGKLILKDLRSGQDGSGALTSRQVSSYFNNRGYVVCNVSPIKESKNWRAYLIKNGEYIIATAFTKEDFIEGYVESIE
jgi:hypothetical protein